MDRPYLTVIETAPYLKQAEKLLAPWQMEEVVMMVAVGSQQHLGGHAEKAGRFPHRHTALHEPGCRCVAAGRNQAFVFAGQNSNTVANSVTWFESIGNTIVRVT